MRRISISQPRSLAFWRAYSGPNERRSPPPLPVTPAVGVGPHLYDTLGRRPVERRFEADRMRSPRQSIASRASRRHSGARRAERRRHDGDADAKQHASVTSSRLCRRPLADRCRCSGSRHRSPTSSAPSAPAIWSPTWTLRFRQRGEGGQGVRARAGGVRSQTRLAATAVIQWPGGVGACRREQLAHNCKPNYPAFDGRGSRRTGSIFPPGEVPRRVRA